MNEFTEGQQLCHCKLLKRCGSGAYGEVWLAEDEVGARIALKIVQNGGKFSEREIAGLRNYRGCNHPNLLRIRHIEITPDYLFYTMDAADDLHHGCGDYLPDTLSNRLIKFTRLDGSEITDMLNGLLAGLSELHRHKLVHRDIKPDNILWVNGRPTLADAGLITQAGAGSLVGTPGFLSPRLLSGKSSAEPEDDFYALGKVIYCALTGYPIEKYPSIPPELTLSGNADWNRLFSEICESPVSSAEAFREKMQFHPNPSRSCVLRRCGIALLLLMIGLAFFLWTRKTNDMTSAVTETVPSPGLSLSRQVHPSAPVKWDDAAFPALAALRTAGLYDTEHLEALLNLPWYSDSDFFLRIGKCVQNPRMSGFPRYRSDKKASPLEQELIEICRDYKEFCLSDLKSKQFYWHSCQGDPLTIQRTMLAEDPIMQGVALDFLLFGKIDAVLASGKMTDSDKEQLKKWIQLKNSLFL